MEVPQRPLSQSVGERWGVSPKPIVAMDHRGTVISGVLASVGGLLVLFGSLGPWLTVSSGLSSAARPGIAQFEGQAILALSVVALLLIARSAAGHPKTAILATAAFVFAGIIASFDLNQSLQRVADQASEDNSVVFVGWGIYAILAGSVLGFFGSLWQSRQEAK